MKTHIGDVRGGPGPESITIHVIPIPQVMCLMEKLEKCWYDVSRLAVTREVECHTCCVMARLPGQLGLALGLEHSEDNNYHVVLPGSQQPGEYGS